MKFRLDRLHNVQITKVDYPSDYMRTWWNENARRLEVLLDGLNTVADVSGTGMKLLYQGNTVATVGVLGLTFGHGYNPILTEVAAASVITPPSGCQTLFIDTADHKLKRKDGAGTVTTIA